MRWNQHRLRFRHSLSIGLGIIVLCGCYVAMKNHLKNVPSGQAARLIEQHVDYYAEHLQIGMSRDEALSFLPKPENTNSQDVCVWVLESTEKVKTGRSDWQWLQATRGGYFIVFVDGKLATPLCANAAFSPWQALQHYAHLTSEQAEKVLGPPL
jgi:hypothetical protein